MIYFLGLFKVVLKLISKDTCMAIKIMFLCSTPKIKMPWLQAILIV